MYIAYLIVTALAAAANFFSAGCDFVRYKQVSIAMARAGVPDSWMTTLGILKAAGGIGLLIGIGIPPIGMAAAIGLTLFICRGHRHPSPGTRLHVRLGYGVSRSRRGCASAGTVCQGIDFPGADGKVAAPYRLDTYRK